MTDAPESRSISRPLVVAASIAVIATIALLPWSREVSADPARARVAEVAEAATNDVRLELEAGHHAATEVADFVRRGADLFESFHSLAADIMARNSSITGIAWAEQLPGGQIEAWGQERDTEGHLGVRVNEHGPTILEDEDRTRLPVTLIAPRTPRTVQQLGHSIAPDAIARRAARAALESRSMSEYLEGTGHIAIFFAVRKVPLEPGLLPESIGLVRVDLELEPRAEGSIISLRPQDTTTPDLPPGAVAADEALLLVGGPDILVRAQCEVRPGERAFAYPLAVHVCILLITGITGWFVHAAGARARNRAEEHARIRDQVAEATKALTDRNRVLDETRAELEVFHQAMDAAAIVTRTNAAGTITEANENFLKLSGFDREEVVGENHRIVNSGHHPEEFFGEMFRTLGRGEVWRGQIRNRAKDGDIFWVDTCIVPRVDEDGRPQEFTAIRFDITERMAAEERVREAEVRLSQTIDAAGAGTWDLDVEGRMISGNERFYSICGEPWVIGSIMDRWMWRRIHPDDVAAVEEAYEAAWNDADGSLDTEYRVRHNDGSWRWIISRGRVTDRGDDGRALRMSGQNFDVTERRETEARLELLVDSSRVGTWDLDARTGIHEVNEYFLHMVGESTEGATSVYRHPKWLVDRIHPDDLALFEDALEAANRDPNGAYEAEYRVRHSDGTYRWFSSRGRVVTRDGDGSPNRIMGQTSDITQRREDEIELEKARAAAEAASQAKSDFLANMSHEIRTPMTAIIGFAGVLTEDEGRDADSIARRHDAAATIVRNGENLLQIINDILDISKIEAGRLEVEAREADLAGLLRDVRELMAGRAEGKGITLTVEPDGKLPRVFRSDELRLRQILVNLVGNAIKFTETGGIVIRPRMEAAGDGDPARLAIDIVDSGIGLSEAAQERIFGSFQQADTSTTRTHGGTGLGLTISKRLANLLGGDITVTSKVGTGSTFTVTVDPGLDDAAEMLDPDALMDESRTKSQAEEAAPATLRTSPLENRRILLVEDGIDNRRLIGHHLRKAGAEVVEAVDGCDGVARWLESELSGRTYDVILSDMQMPVMDGYAGVARLRHSGCTLPIVALTAHAMTGDRERCIEAGCDEYLTKPVDRTAMIDLCIRLSEARDEGEADGPHAISDGGEAGDDEVRRAA